MYFHMQRAFEPITSLFIFGVEGYTNLALTVTAAPTPRPPSVIALLMMPRRCSSCVWYSLGGILGSAVKVTDQVCWLPCSATCCSLVSIHLLTSTAVSALSVSGWFKPDPLQSPVLQTKTLGCSQHEKDLMFPQNLLIFFCDYQVGMVGVRIRSWGMSMKVLAKMWVQGSVCVLGWGVIGSLFLLWNGPQNMWPVNTEQLFIFIYGWRTSNRLWPQSR